MLPVRGSVLAVPLADGCADVVVAGEILEHVEDDVAVLAECARLLRPGGQPGGREGVEQQQSARAQQPGALRQHRDVVLDVLQDLAGQHHVGAAVGQRHLEHRAATGCTPCSRASARPGRPMSTPTCR